MTSWQVVLWGWAGFVAAFVTGLLLGKARAEDRADRLAKLKDEARRDDR